MKLDRNMSGNGRGKYGLIKNRRLQEILATVGNSRNAKNMDEVWAMRVRGAIRLLEEEGILDWGDKPETEFFVIRLKDINADMALYEYAKRAMRRDPEYGREVLDLALRAGPNHPNGKAPD